MGLFHWNYKIEFWWVRHDGYMQLVSGYMGSSVFNGVRNTSTICYYLGPQMWVGSHINPVCVITLLTFLM